MEMCKNENKNDYFSPNLEKSGRRRIRKPSNQKKGLMFEQYEMCEMIIM